MGDVSQSDKRTGWGTNRVFSEERDYENQVVIGGVVILVTASNPIKSVSEIKQQISHVATHIFN